MYERDLGSALLAVARRYPDRPALWARGQRLSYSELFDRAGRIATAMRAAGVQAGERVAILSHRTSTAYIGIIAALLNGCTYVPLNTRFPVERNGTMLRASNARAMIVDERCTQGLDRLWEGSDTSPVIVTPESYTAIDMKNCRHLSAADFVDRASDLDALLAGLDSETPAYLLFTSGTTGAPKGVAISHANVAAYLAAQFDYAPIFAKDRVLQAVELTFDISVLDMFTAWIAGAELHVAPENSILFTPRIIAEHAITATCLVPTTVTRALQNGLLPPGSLPSLRMSIFGGEAVPVPAMRAWQEAAPNCAIWSLYGPTELTIACTYYPYLRHNEPDLPIMPLGKVHKGMRLGLLDPDSGALVENGPGEILATGDQVSPGYWRAPHIDAEKFVVRDGARWYRTGDVGRWTREYGYIFAGRADRQIKIRGFRVELIEIEGAVRKAGGRENVAVIPWPLLSPGNAGGCVAFVAGPVVDAAPILKACADELPEYMVPSQVLFCVDLPVNENGKIDYRALAADSRLQK